MEQNSSRRLNKKLLQKRREKSITQERRIAKQTGGRTTIASGALGEKSDVVSGEDLNLRFEAKRTCKKQLTLKLEDVRKIIMEAHMSGNVPAIHLEIQETSFYLLPDYFALELFELWKSTLTSPTSCSE